MRRKYWLVLVLLASLVTACGGSAPQSSVPTAAQGSAGSEATSAPAPAAATEAPAPAAATAAPAAPTAGAAQEATAQPAAGAAAGTADRRETLNVAISGKIDDPTNFNLYAPGVSRSGTGLHQVVYEYFFYNNLQTGEFIPWLAKDYKYSDDFKSMTVHLRDGVTWSDGKPFTADDVVFTYDLLRKNTGMVWAEEANKRVASVEKTDDLTVKFNLTEANPRFHEIREAFPAVGIWGGITILPKHIWEGKDPLTFKNNPPVGTGPYKLANATGTAITYERRDDWWGIKAFGVTPGPKVINFEYVGPETTTALALSSNDIDTPFIGILSLGSFQQVAGQNPKVGAWQKGAPYAWLDPCPRPLMVQNAHAPWDKKEARWALSYLIDRQSIANLAYEGTTVPSWGIWPFYDGLKPYFDAIKDLRDKYPTETFDAAKAEQMFGALGYKKDADGILTSADGKKLKVTYVVDADSTEEMKVSAVLADQLKAGGIDVEVQSLSGGALEDAVLKGDYDIKLHSFCPGYIFDNLELFHSKFYAPIGQKAPWFERNSFRYQNKAFDAIVDKMAAIPPDQTDQLTKLYHDAMQIWFDDLPVIPVVQAPALVPFNTTYWQGWPTADNAWNMPVSWWATFNLVISGYPSPKTGKWVGGIKPAQ